MKKKQDNSEKKKLRKRAEEFFQPESDDIRELSHEKMQHIIHELRTHQIELELQNEDLRQTQEELLVSQKKYTDLYDFAPVGYLTISDKGTIIKANLKAAEMFGVERSFLDKQNLTSLLSADQQSHHYLCRKRLLETKESQTCEKVIRKKDGSEIDVHCRCVIRSDIDGDLGQFRTVMTDISERKMAVKEKDRLEAEVRQSQKMQAIGTLAGGIAHDFNNLLYVISGNTELAMEDIPEWNPVHTNLEEIKSASLRAAGVVRQLLDYSHKSDQKLEPIGVVNVIKDALKFLRSTIPTTVDIRKHLPDVDITIRADPIQINQVMMNLCINASQAMEDTGGIIEINVDNVSLTEESAGRYVDLSAGDYLKITVSDTGPGMALEIMDQIFHPYFSTKETGKGSGMGLSIVHGIVKNHEGAVSVESKLGKGTTFILLFPVVAEKPEIETEIRGEISRGHETILFVDDEESITDMTQRMLERLGYTVETSLNPVKALDLFLSKPDAFDLVITDMTMPQMTGIRLFEKLREIRSDIPVIICTGHSSLINAESAKQRGAADYVMKPASWATIAKAIRKVLDKEDDK
jgi:PAS domain S-box-containing protein